MNGAVYNDNIRKKTHTSHFNICSNVKAAESKAGIKRKVLRWDLKISAEGDDLIVRAKLL